MNEHGVKNLWLPVPAEERRSAPSLSAHTLSPLVRSTHQRAAPAVSLQTPRATSQREPRWLPAGYHRNNQCANLKDKSGKGHRVIDHWSLGVVWPDNKAWPWTSEAHSIPSLIILYLVWVSEDIRNPVDKDDVPHEESKQSGKCRAFSMNTLKGENRLQQHKECRMYALVQGFPNLWSVATEGSLWVDFKLIIHHTNVK